MLRIGIADSCQLVTDGIGKLLEHECEIVGVARDGRAAIALAAQTKPQVMLLETSLPLLNGFDTGRQIKLENPGTELIFVTAHTSREYLRAAFDAGAAGYVLKQEASTFLLQAIREVTSGQKFVAPTLRKYFAESSTEEDMIGFRTFTNLTPRQREVLQLVGEGMSAKEIATALEISTKTVEFHKKNLMIDLGLQTSAQLIRYFLQEVAA